MAEQDGRNADWKFELEHFRTRFEHLYAIQQRSLNDVMEILKKEGCYASRNMYLRKIRAWNIKKNVKWENRQKGAQALEKSTAKEAMAPFKRREDLPLEARIRYFCPLMRQPKDQDMGHHFFQTAYDLQRWTASTNLIARADDVSPALDRFQSSFITGTALMQRNEIQAGGALIEQGLRAAEPALKEMGSPLLYFSLFITLSMTYHQAHELSRMFVKFIYQLSMRTLGALHSFTRLFKILYEQHQANGQEDVIFNLTFTALRIALDAMQTVVGKLEEACMGLRSVVNTTNRMMYTSVQDVCSGYEAYIRDSDESKLPMFMIGSRRAYAVYLYTQNRLPEAIPLLREGGSILYQEPPPSSISVTEAAVKSSYEWGELVMEQTPSNSVEEQQARYLEAERILKMTIERAILLLGPQNHETVMASQTLAEFYSKYGHPDEAKAQQDFVMEQLAEFKLG